MVARLPTKLEILFLQSSQLLAARVRLLGRQGVKVGGGLRSRSAPKHLTKGFHMGSKVLTGDRPSGIFRGFGWARGEPGAGLTSCSPKCYSTASGALVLICARQSASEFNSNLFFFFFAIMGFISSQQNDRFNHHPSTSTIPG